MTTPLEHRRAFLQLLLAACVIPARGRAYQSSTAGKSVAPNVSLDAATSSYHVHPGGRIQDALEAAAKDSANKKVVVHAGTYRPSTPGQAMIWFNARHDGITLEAAGDVILTAANPELADRRAPSFPAVVNHIIYFGDGISRKTVLRGFKITGAKNFTTGSGDKSPIESDDLRKTPFFYTDGGGITITRGRIRRSSRSRSTRTTRAPAAAASRSSTCSRCRTRRSSATASSATTAPRPRAPRSTSCTTAPLSSKTVSSSATSPTWASTWWDCSAARSISPSTAPVL